MLYHWIPPTEYSGNFQKIPDIAIMPLDVNVFLQFVLLSDLATPLNSFQYVNKLHQLFPDWSFSDVHNSVRLYFLGWLLRNNYLTQRKYVALVAQIDASITDMGKLHWLP